MHTIGNTPGDPRCGPCDLGHAPLTSGIMDSGVYQVIKLHQTGAIAMTDPSNELVEQLVAELRQNGIVTLPDLVAPERLKEMQTAFRARLRRMRCNDLEGYEKELYRHVIQDALTVAQGFVDIALHPILKRVLTEYLGDAFVLAEAKGWRSLPTTRDFHGWHGDAWYDEGAVQGTAMPLEVKLAFYLTDVQSGAFNYIPRSHRKHHPRLVPNTEAQALASTGLVEQKGRAGTAFLFDTSGTHRQGVPILEPREAVFYNFHDPTVKLQPEIWEYYRYHPLLLNAAFLGDLSREDQRILGFGDKRRYQPAHERSDSHPILHRGFTRAYDATLRVQNFKDRLQAGMRRVLHRRG